jgi:hypothetical protein
MGPYPDGIFGDSVGPGKQPNPTSTYTHTTRQTFDVQVGGKTFSLSTVVRQQTIVRNGVVISVTATIVKP